MSHDTGHGHKTENTTIISFKNSFWLVVVLVGLFVAALNFINVESRHEGGEGHEGHEETNALKGHGGHDAKRAEIINHNAEATEAEKPAETAPASDSAAHH